MRILLVNFLFFLSIAASATELTSHESLLLDEFAKSVETSCTEQVNSNLARQSPRTTAAARWMRSASSSPDYCSCVASTVRSRATSAIFRSRTSAQGVLEHAANSCTVQRLKSTIYDFCRDAILEITPPNTNENIRTEVENTTCSCLQRQLEPLQPEQLDAYTEASARDNQLFRDTGKLASPESFSLIGHMNKCGMPSLRKRLGAPR